jgi:hypothetical protein
MPNALVGSWELLSRIDRTPKGEERVETSLGANPIAFLVFDRTGHFAVQFMKRDRTHAVDAPAPGANNSRARGGYDAYFGGYTYDEARGELKTRLAAALSPENVGQEFIRRAAVEGEMLTLQLDTTAPSGEAVTRTLRWKRVA